MGSDLRPSLDTFDEASRPFVAALRDGEAGERAAALAEIAPVVDDRLARELLRFARDPGRQPAERGGALIALGPALEETGLEDEGGGGLPVAPEDDDWWGTPLSTAGFREVHDELRRIYHDGAQPKEVRRRALEAGVRAVRPWHRDAVATAWRSGDPEWRLTAVFAMGYVAGFEDEIEEAFRGDDPALRRQATLSAGLAELEHLAPELLAVATDRDAGSADRVAALAALAELQQVDAEDELEALVTDPDTGVAQAARDALEEIRGWSDVDEEDVDFDLDDLESLDWEEDD